MPTATIYSFGLKELNSKEHHLYKSSIAEFIGNFILNFFVYGAFTQPEDGVFKALSFGLAVFMVVTIIGHLSGGHANPAITLSMLIVGRISVIRSIFYIVAQCLGAAVGTSVAKAFLDEAYHSDLSHTTLAANITEIQGLGMEFCTGFLLVLTVFGACDVNKPDLRYTAPFAIGMSVTLGHLGTLRYTGCGMNPARTFGTAYVTNNWNSHWVYWAGPIFGGIVAAIVYTQLFEVSEKPKPPEPSDKYRIHAYERELRKFDNPVNFV